jgi:uncharacterized membrane protein
VPIPYERTPSARWSSLALLALTLGVAAWRLRVLATEDLWFDEVFSAVLASRGPGELLRSALVDQTNPPGFYLALWAWARLGSLGTTWLRALPALAGLAVIPAVAWSAERHGMTRGAAFVAAALAAASPLLLAMGGEVRAYAPLALATTLLLALALRVASAAAPSRASLIALAVVNVVAASLHYFGALACCTSLVATAWIAPSRVRHAMLAALPAVFLTGAWLVTVFVSAGDRPVGANADWIGPLELGALPSFASQVVGSLGTRWGAWCVLIAIGAAIVAAARVARGPAAAAETAANVSRGLTDRDRARWLLVTALLPLLIVAMAGPVTGRSIWVARYLVIVLPPLWLLLADATTRMRGPPRLMATAALVAWAALSGPLAERSRTPKPSWSLVVRAFAGGGPVRVCVNEAFVGLPLRYYAIVEGVALEVQDLPACTRTRDAALVLTRPGTESSLAVLERAGARLGPARSLGTQLPEVDRRAIRWDPR